MVREQPEGLNIKPDPDDDPRFVSNLQMSSLTPFLPQTNLNYCRRLIFHR